MRPLESPHDHRHRLREGRRRADPPGGRGDRRPRRRERGLLGDGSDRPDRAGPRAPPRRCRRCGGRSAEQGFGRHLDRDAHRLPRLLTTRSGVRLRSRRRLRPPNAGDSGRSQVLQSATFRPSSRIRCLVGLLAFVAHTITDRGPEHVGTEQCRSPSTRPCRNRLMTMTPPTDERVSAGVHDPASGIGELVEDRDLTHAALEPPPTADTTPPGPPAARGPEVLTVLAGGLVVGVLAVLVRVAAAPLVNTDTYFHLRFGAEFLHHWSLVDPGSVSTFATRTWLPTQWLPEIAMAKMEAWFGLAGVAWLFGVQL